MKSSELRPGMKGTAWTVSSRAPSRKPVPVEIIGLWKNAWGRDRTSSWPRWAAKPSAPMSPAA